MSTVEVLSAALGAQMVPVSLNGDSSGEVISGQGVVKNTANASILKITVKDTMPLASIILLFSLNTLVPLFFPLSEAPLEVPFCECLNVHCPGCLHVKN